jgi:chromosome segregation ATPase
MTCIHIERAKIKLDSLEERLNNDNSRVYETLSYVDKSSIKSHLDSSGVIFKDYTAKTIWTNSNKKIINKSVLEEYLNDLKRDFSDCNCFSDANSRANALNEASRKEAERLFNRFERVENNYREQIDEQSSVIREKERENSIIARENSNLQNLLGLSKAQAEHLEIQLVEKNNELNQNNQALEKLRGAFQNLLVSNATNATEARVIKEQLIWTKSRLEVNDSRITIFENKLDQKQQELENSRQSLTTLQIAYQAETQENRAKIKQQENEIKLLKEKAGEAQENLFDAKENYKEESLEGIASQLGISLEYINKLRKHYERLIDARKNFNRSNIETHESCIAAIKQEMVDQGIYINYIQKICRKCEKLSEIRFELEKTRQEQHQNQQEQRNY